jgi:hypothetical protein
MHKTATIVALALAVAGCTGGLPPEVGKLGYVDRGLRFGMDVPQGWTVRESNSTTPVIVTGPGPEGDRPNVSVTVPADWNGLALDDLVRASRRDLERLPGFQPVSEGEFAAAGGRQAYAITFRQTLGGTAVVERQLYVVAGGRAYIVTAAARADAFAGQEANFDVCFRSFRAGWQS